MPIQAEFRSVGEVQPLGEWMVRRKAQGEIMQRLEMREQTRRAVSDVCGIMLANYGIVPTFQQVADMAVAIDREMLRFGQCAATATPDEWQQMRNHEVKTVRIGDA